VVATIFWSVSFPIVKAMGLVQAAAIPEGSTWFASSVWVLYRFGAAGLIMFLWTAPRLGGLTRLEFEQDWAWACSAAGACCAVDGLAYTTASTSAFLTQCYCLFIPLWLAVRERRWPSPLVLACCLIVFAGVAILADVDWAHFRLGRGEFETILASVLFTGQILWLQRPKYAQNDLHRFTQVMFLVTGAVRPASRAGHHPRAGGLAASLWHAITSHPDGGPGRVLYLRRFPPDEPLAALNARHPGGLDYCAEPVFTSLLVLFLPVWLGTLAGVAYADETITWRLLAGGSLITVANVVLTLLPPPPAAEPASRPATAPLGQADETTASG
jgi:drug/metabolite transporter (DMT)-like permease